MLRNVALNILLLVSLTGCLISKSFASPDEWKKEWPKTDFSKTSIDLQEIFSGGIPKDGIESIDNPKFVDIDEARRLKLTKLIDNPKFVSINRARQLIDTSPVISLEINGDVRAYPIAVMMVHEIVNDTVGGIPVVITYCPLCNASLVFERTVDGKILDFGVTGKLRNSDLIMYDKQTESWWQQFLGVGMVGKMDGKKLKQIPSRIESFALFKERYKSAKVLQGYYSILYTRNSYKYYDTSKWPMFFKGNFDEKIYPLSYVVMVGKDAWPLDLVRRKGKVKYKGIEIRWIKGQNSALDTRYINKGRDIGNIIVTRDGKIINHAVPFAFAFKAFHPDGIIHYGPRNVLDYQFKKMKDYLLSKIRLRS